MTQIAEQLKEQLAELDDKDRAELAHFLLRSLDPGEVNVTENETDVAWEAELLRRAGEIEAGSVEGISVEEVIRELRERYR